MIRKFKELLKKSLITALCMATTTTTILTGLPVAFSAGSSSILGTNRALGSPILNNNFTVDNWNPWEYIAWGVFLSNFCQPLIDNYQTAFKATGDTSTSNGAGYRALCFGSGNDLTNNDVIEAMCDFAIQQQLAESPKQLYVAWVEVTGGKIGDQPDLSGDLEAAKAKDFFLKSSDPGERASWVSSTAQATVYSGYSELSTIGEGSLPVFYIKNDTGQYIEVFNFSNAWDIQIFGAMINNVRQNTAGNDLTDEFFSNLNQYATSDDPVTMDVFGNIMIGNAEKMLIPASCNQHLTVDNQINLLNSWVLNSYNSTYSESQMILGLRQTTGKIFGIFETRSSGGPAFGNSVLGNTGFLYYDTDSIVAGNGSAVSNSAGINTVDYGKLLEELFSLGIDNNVNRVPIKFEISGTDNNGSGKNRIIKDMFSSDSNQVLTTTLFAAASIPNIAERTTQPKMLTELISFNGDPVPLFSSTPVAVPVQLAASTSRKEPSNEGARRHLFQFLYGAYTGKTNETANGTFDKSDVLSILDNVSEPADLRNAFGEKKNLELFKKTYTTYKDNNIDSFISIGAGTLNYSTGRVALVYPISDIMRSVSQVLGVNENMEQSSFAKYSTMLYMAYLDWYGVINSTASTGGTEKVSKFDPNIFNPNSDTLTTDITEAADTVGKDADALKEEVQLLGYYALHPEDGREYRKNLVVSGIADFIFEQYNRICYGGTYTTYSGSSSKNDSGFLAIETYMENPLTSWIFSMYAEIALILIMSTTLAVVLVGLIKGKKITWYILSMITIVTSILVLPTTGEIVPYITSSAVQSLFSPKMTYWSISEGVSNSDLEEEYISEASALDAQNLSTATNLIKSLSALYTDRSLMLKQDISQKLVQNTAGIYQEAQSMQSTRWLLPMLMQQFSANTEKESTDYLYVKLSNVWDDCSNLYWFLNPADANNVTKPTMTSDQAANMLTETIYTKGSLAHDADTSVNDVNTKKVDTNINYKHFGYSINQSKTLPHTYLYLLNNQGTTTLSRKSVFGAGAELYGGVDSWQKYIDASLNSHATVLGNWRTDNGRLDSIEEIADTYDRTDITTFVDSMTYLLSTQSPIYYFFASAKDSFTSDVSLGYMIGQLQGQLEVVDGKEVRKNFMYATTSASVEDVEQSNATATGLVRDILDLEEMFTNMIPYMYEMQLIAGGFDGKSGILVEGVSNSSNKKQPLKISDKLPLYEGEYQSWMYRCNWATKIMENSRYANPSEIGTVDGSRVKITNPLLPEAYPANRPMVFSEAQQVAMGLNDQDLSLVELKCIEVNKRVAEKWTYLINYAGTSGLTKEILFRQMATDALLIFNEEFGDSGLLNSIYRLYPTTIDLRHLSFDSIMKMLMLNVSKDTSYIYGNTMEKLISDSNIGLSILLLLVTALCVDLIPFMRSALMAVLLILTLWASIRAIFSSTQFKLKIACGQFVSNVLFIIYTIGYYCVIFAMMKISSSDEVLSVRSVQVEPGNPAFLLIILILVSILYVFIMAKQIKFCWVHRRDMGMEYYSAMASAVVSKIQKGLDGIGDAMSGANTAIDGVGSRLESFFDSEHSIESSKGGKDTRAKAGKSNEKYSKSGKVSTGAVVDDDSDLSESDILSTDSTTADYKSNDTTEESTDITADVINAVIDAGAEK